MREAWTDERLDDLQTGMHREFDLARAEARQNRAEAKAQNSELRAEMNARFDAMSTRFDAMNARFDGMQRLIIGLFGSTLAAVVGAIVVNAL